LPYFSAPSRKASEPYISVAGLSVPLFFSLALWFGWFGLSQDITGLRGTLVADRFALFFRTSILVPYITSVAATAIVFAQMFDRDYGLLNWLLGLVGIGSIDFVQTVWGSHVMIAVMVAWRWFGYTALLYLASLQSIPRDIYEAASIDGAGGWHQFRHITIPSLRPVIIFTVVTSTIGGLQIFTEPLLAGRSTPLTCGPTRECQTLTLFLYEQGFGGYEFGYAATIGVALFVMIVAIALINYLLSTRIRSER
jgi:cellobiose transport system permease protein